MKYVEAIEPYNINEAEHNKVQSLTKKHRIQNRPSSTQLNTATKVAKNYEPKLDRKNSPQQRKFSIILIKTWLRSPFDFVRIRKLFHFRPTAMNKITDGNIGEMSVSREKSQFNHIELDVNAKKAEIREKKESSRRTTKYYTMVAWSIS